MTRRYGAASVLSSDRRTTLRVRRERDTDRRHPAAASTDVGGRAQNRRHEDLGDLRTVRRDRCRPRPAR
ncbi:hypothetical protein N136_01530 [Leifsonia aquatica ATCC 14665]|uniref:Uncharacterized protein n=1 Tax=Leifsonia aquatica ATCC 14665 TaxID=1358026 RepID=U2TBN5_LEIAQ|nr:hypothetical protein N136_01530 [Leifsonia aquatica ATCC 14665]